MKAFHFLLLLLLALSAWVLQELALCQLLRQPGWRSLLTRQDRWGTVKKGKDWEVYRGGGSGGDYYSLRAGHLRWNTCYDSAEEFILGIDERGESPRFLVYQPAASNNNHYFLEHPEELVVGYWLIEKAGDNYERHSVMNHPVGLLLRQVGQFEGLTAGQSS